MSSRNMLIRIRHEVDALLGSYKQMAGAMHTSLLQLTTESKKQEFAQPTSWSTNLYVVSSCSRYSFIIRNISVLAIRSHCAL